MAFGKEGDSAWPPEVAVILSLGLTEFSLSARNGNEANTTIATKTASGMALCGSRRHHVKIKTAVLLLELGYGSG
jgi:hypothetical protein